MTEAHFVASWDWMRGSFVAELRHVFDMYVRLTGTRGVFSCVPLCASELVQWSGRVDVVTLLSLLPLVPRCGVAFGTKGGGERALLWLISDTFLT